MPTIPHHPDPEVRRLFKAFAEPEQWAEDQPRKALERPAPPPAEKRYLTIQELASYLGVSRWSLYKLVQRRKIPFIPLTFDGGGENGKCIVRFDVQEIDRWLKRKSVIPLSR